MRHQADDAGVGHRLGLGRVLSWNVGGDGQTIGAGSHTKENQKLYLISVIIWTNEGSVFMSRDLC